MQENLSSVKGSAPTPKPTKYRLACDSCQHSKIRCNQERPKCRRCAKKGIECVYSPARRAGRPRTRNNNKSTSSIENNVSASLERDLTSIPENGITIPDSGWMSPFAPPSILSASENCSSYSSSTRSNTSTIPCMGQTIQMPSPDDMDLSSYQHSDDSFLQGLPDFTGSQCGTPKQTTDGYYPSSSEFHIAAGLLDLGFCGTPWEQQQQQREHEQHLTPSNMALDEGLPYFGLLTPEEDHQSRHHRNQHQEDIPLSTTNSSNSESFRYGIPLQDQTQSRFLQPIDYAPPPTISCTCVSALLDHLSTPTHATSSSFLASTSAALSTSKIIITSCYTTMECPKACFMRPSTVLVICEAIDRALVSLKLGGTSLWVPNQGFDNGTSPSPLSSPSLSSTSSGNGNDIMLPSLEMVDEEHEPLRCGTLPIRGADRRAVVRVLLVKRILEIQGVLERLRDILLSALAAGGDAAAKKPLLALCANVVGEFAKKVAERLETVKLQPLECDG